jgi:hypothetical protein
MDGSARLVPTTDVEIVVRFKSERQAQEFLRLYKDFLSKQDPKNAEREESFKKFYSMYGKQVTKKPSLLKWLKLTDQDIERIMAHVPRFVKATPDVKYRPNPLTYLNQRRWEDEEVEVKKFDLPSWAKPADFRA